MDPVTKKQKKREDKERKKAERVAKKAAKRAGKKPSVLLQEFWNVPNMLTVARMLIIPLFVWFTYDADPWYSLMAALLFVIASVTDIIDGWLARKMNVVTVVGKFMDPLADKLIVMAALVMMVRLGRMPAWIVIVLLSREFIVTGLRQVAASEGLVIAAGQEGKWKTSLQLVGVIALCVHYPHMINYGWATYRVDFNAVGKVCIYLSTLFSVWSMGNYFQAFMQTLAKQRNPSRSS
ncbi:MAG: CDP-diacylglycerol--glycerol-3-phosphate 3-phosphatidyltransferase [Myxococcaceae bacterium]